ncbi:MAG: hypothetical protein KDG52_15040 [Rhodocyclaceae bacterium]|nr:hypothetical protein [Rhodocyclaceae bacterium]
MPLRPAERGRAGALLRACLLALTLGAPLAAAAGDDISAAEHAVFLDEHLRGLDDRHRLRYDFVLRENAVAVVEDTVTLDVRHDADRGRVVNAEFLHGENQLSLPEVDHAEANPVVLYFLERDVREMRRRLGGMENYFRKRIRLALADDAGIEPVTFEYRGRRIQGSRVAVDPYRGDPNQHRFRGMDSKRYEFTLSEQVPGGIYRLRTSVEPPAGAEGPRIEEVLTLSDSEP